MARRRDARRAASAHHTAGATMSAVGLMSAASASAIPAATARPRPAATQAATTKTASAPSRKPRTPLLSHETGSAQYSAASTTARRGVPRKSASSSATPATSPSTRRQLDRRVLGLAVVEIRRHRGDRAPRPAPERHRERRVVDHEVAAPIGHEPQRLGAAQLRDEVAAGNGVRVAVDARDAVRVGAGGPGLPVLRVPRARGRQEDDADPGAAHERGHDRDVAQEAPGLRASERSGRAQREEGGPHERAGARGQREQVEHGRRGEQEEGRRRERDRQRAARVAPREEHIEDERDEQGGQHARPGHARGADLDRGHADGRVARLELERRTARAAARHPRREAAALESRPFEGGAIDADRQRRRSVRRRLDGDRHLLPACEAGQDDGRAASEGTRRVGAADERAPGGGARLDAQGEAGGRENTRERRDRGRDRSGGAQEPRRGHAADCTRDPGVRSV